MKIIKKAGGVLLALALCLTVLTGCSAPQELSPAQSPTPQPTEVPSVDITPEPEAAPAQKEKVRVAALKGPTGMGMVQVMKNAGASTQNDYEFQLISAPDEAVALLTSGEVDIAALPTNLAATLYNKTNGGVQLAALNTLGVLHLLSRDGSVQSIGDLAGKTVYLTGQGAMPEYVVNFILEQNGLADQVTLEYKGEHAELAALAASGDAEVCVLPEPFASSVLAKNEKMARSLDLTEEWDKAAELAGAADSVLSMGCLVVRSEFAGEHKAAVDAFLTEYQASVEYVTGNPAAAAQDIAQYGLVENAALAEKIIPGCHIVFVAGDEMEQSISKLYEVLFAANPKSVGGSIPNEDFFYKP